MRDALNELSGKDELNQEAAQRYEDLPAQIESAKKELEKHQRAERAMADSISTAADRGASTHTNDGGIYVPQPAKQVAAETPTEEQPRVFATPRKNIEPNTHCTSLAGVLGQIRSLA